MMSKNQIELEEFLNSCYYIVPLIYKDFGRTRGPIASVIAFERIFKEFEERSQFVNVKCIRVEVDEIKDLYKNKLFRDKILFSFNFIQDIESRGMYPLIARKHDICFSKKNIKGKNPYDFVNEYAQTKPYATNTNMKFFPKYFSFSKKRSATTIFNSFKKLAKFTPLRLKPENGPLNEEDKLKIGIYYRRDTCQIQANIYDTIIKRYKDDFIFKLYGDENEVDLANETLDVDLFLYTHPSHLDPWPNIIFDALTNSIPIIRVVLSGNDEGKLFNSSGILFMQRIFPTMFMSVDFKLLGSLPLALRKYRFWRESDIIGAINHNSVTSGNLLRETKNAIAKHIGYCKSEINLERLRKKNEKLNLIIPNMSQFGEKFNLKMEKEK